MTQLSRILRLFPIVESDGTATPDFQLKYQRNCESIEQAIASLQTQVDLIATAQAAANAAIAAAATANAAAATATTAASTAQSTVDASKAVNSLVNSYPSGITISAANTGVVTISAHSRIYGDTVLNPTVAVTGNTVASGAVATSVVRIYYNDATRAGGAVSYLFTVDPAAAPVQGGNVHSVGAVTIPAGAPVNGGPVRAPGYADPVP